MMFVVCWLIGLIDKYVVNEIWKDEFLESKNDWSVDDWIIGWLIDVLFDWLLLMFVECLMFVFI
mgnify:CR=1 FL=1